MSLREMLSDYWYAFQQELFPRLESELGPMGERYELFVAVLELVRVEALLPYFRGQVGRPEENRAALARAFIAKAVFDIPTTRALIERLEVDGRLCRLCGWSGGGRLPSEATFSRAFSEFAESRLASRLHETLIARTMDGHLVEHISRDATAIEAREKPAPKPKRRRKRGRPRKGVTCPRRLVRFDACHPCDGDIPFTTASSSRFAVHHPVADALSSLGEVQVREVVAANDVVVVPGVRSGVEHGLHDPASPALHSR